MTRDEKYMTLALQQAQVAFELGEIPVGAVIVKDDAVIAFGHNTRETHKSALGHAEITAIHNACMALGSWRLSGCELFVTLEPCPMCAGAVLNSRIDRLVFAAFDPKSGSVGSVTDLFASPFDHHPDMTSGILSDKSLALLTAFFKQLREKCRNR